MLAADLTNNGFRIGLSRRLHSSGFDDTTLEESLLAQSLTGSH